MHKKPLPQCSMHACSLPADVDPCFALHEGALFVAQGKVAKWWVPDDCVLVKEIPHTATGKISKLEPRKQFKDYRPQRARM
jgi:non-ribosomal peptide synthetase component E (peptide arylation enzyme)